MSRKLLSVLLAVLMVISSVSCLFTANTVTATAEGENLMASIGPADWTSGWNGSTGVYADMNGIAVKAAYRSAYTKVTLSPEAKHTFSFSFGQVRVGDVRVYPASEITDPATQLMSVGSTPAVGGTTNLATGTFETELAKGAPADGAFYKASETFKTTTDTEYYIILDCYDFVTTSVVLKNISLVEHPYDPNVLADTTNSDWYSNMSTSGANYNATEGAIFVRGAGASVYTKVTLEPYTKYSFSFSSSRVEPKDVVVYAVDDNVTNLSTTTWAAYVSGGTNLAAGALNTNLPEYNFATTTDEEYVIKYYDSSETFTTNAATEYYIAINCGNFGDKLPDGVAARHTGLHLKNLSLLPVEYVLANELVDPVNWSSTWRLQGTTVNITAATESKDGGAGIYVDRSNYRDSFATLILEPNSEYTLSFNYKGISELNRVEVYAKDDIDLEGYKATNSKYPDNLSYAKKSGITAIADYYTKNIGTFDGATWFNVTFKFNTNSNTEYYIVLGHGANSGFTASDLTLEKKFVDPDNVLGNSVASDWTSSWSGSKATETPEGYFKVGVAWRSAYTKVTLEPNTKYNFSFSHGEVRVTDIRVFAASEITDPSTQLFSPGGDGLAPGGTNNLATAAVSTNCPSTPVAGEFYESFESFTTGSETEYYIFLDCGAFITTAILLKDLSLKKHVPNANVDINDTANWNSTWNLSSPGTVSFTKSTDSYEGGEAIAVSKSNYRDTFVKLTLTPNVNYKLTFNYKGASAVSNLYLIALDDIDEAKYAAKPEHIISTFKEGASKVFSQGFAGLNYDGTTWNEVSVEFATNANTEYYLVFENNTGGSGFTASDFNFAIASSDDSEGEVNENILANITKDDFVSTWDGSKGYTLTTMAVKAAWHTAYTKVTLAPNTNYDFSFGASNAKVNNVRVYAASEITDVSTQLTNANEWVAGGTNNLVTAFNSTAPADSYETATEDFISQVYTVSASFTTNTTDTEYYILIDGGQFLGNGAPYATFIFVKNFSLISKGEVYIDPNVLNDTAMTKLTWKALWKDSQGNNTDRTITPTVLDKTQSYSGNSYVMSWGTSTRYRDNYTIVNLEPNTKYQLSFRYKAAGVEEYIHYVGFVASNKVDLTLSAENIEGRLLDSNTEMLGKVNATVEKNLNGTWNLVSTTFTTGEETEYVFYMGIGNYVDNSFSTITFSDFDLREYEDPNKLVDATVANGQVRFSVGADSDAYYITGAEGKEDELVTYKNGEGTDVTRSRVYFYDSIEPQFNYNGGYAWRIILSSKEAMNVYNPAVYGYITAKGLAANTKYTFSYIYTDTYHIKLADIYNADGSVAFDVTTKMLPVKDGATSHSYMVTATFTTGAEGDYNFKLQTGRSNKYYIYDASSWALTLSDLSLVVYEEGDSVEIPDDANLLENPDELDWKATWSTISHSTNGYNGTKAISLGGIQYHALYTRLDTLAPNTEYTLTFKYKSHAAIDVVGVTDAANVNPANVNDKFSSAVVKGGSITYYQNVEKVIDNATWNNATVKFVTGDSTTYYLYIEGNSAANTAVAGGFVISDMSLTKVLDKSNAIVVDYDFENGTTGAVSTTSAADVPSIAEENGNKYLKFTRTNDGVTVPFYYRANQKYVVSFDMKVLSYPTEQLQFRFRTSEGDNNPITYEGNVFAYNNNAYSLVTKDMNGNLLSGPDGLNNNDDYQFKGYKQNIENHTDWVHYEITIDPDYTYYTGLANFGFDAGEAGWSIALDNIKVAALDDTFEQDAEAKFEPTKYAAIRQRTIDTKQGIRVKSSIDTSLLAGDIKVVEYGTLAINNSKLGGKELVYDMVSSNTYGAKLGVAYSADDNKNEIFEQSGNTVTFTGILVGLADYTTDYAVRGYMIAESADGERFVIYEEDTKTVSVYDVVYAILNDGVTNDDDTVANQIVSVNETKYENWVEENYAEETLTGSKTVNLTVSNAASPVIDNYRGFSGTVYHAFGFMEDDTTGRVYDEAMRNTELDRLEDAGVHYVRTRYQSQWIFDDATGYDWNSDRFNYFLNYAKALQERDMEVILQVGWHFDFISQEGTYSIHENDYFNGEGEDLYGESAGVDFTGKSADDIRIIKAAHRYAYMMANTLRLAKAAGVNNINYLSYFVEPSNSYSGNSTAGHDKEQYVLFCRTMRDALEDNYNVNDVKHVGPNEAGYSKLTDYVVKNDPTLFDIITAHNYPEEGDVKKNYKDYYKTMTDNTNFSIGSIFTGNGYMTDFNDYADFLETAQKSNPNAEFWSDEFNIKDFDAYEGRGTSSFYRGLATAMGGIVAQQCGIQNTVLWMSFDQLWTDRDGGTASDESEFMHGIHQCGNAPSLFLSDQPYAQYYPTTLFSKYNGYKNGTVYATNLDDTQNNGVYVGAVKLEDGSWTVSVVNMNSTAVNVNVAFDTAINQTLYRHIVSADKADTYADAKIPEADKTFENVGSTFNDVLPAGSFAVYTGVR